MKVLLVGNYPNDRQESMQRFAAVMEASLPIYGCEVRTIRPRPILAGKRISTAGIGKWLGYADKLLLFPLFLRKAVQWADVVHICDHANATYTGTLKTKAHVVTCHDLLAIRSALGEIPKNPTGWTGRLFQQMIQRGLDRAQRIVCVSEKTKEDLGRVTNLDESRISRVYMGLNFSYQPMASDKAEGILRSLGVGCEPYILHVGLDAWYKNRKGLLEIYRALTCNQKDASRLVMVGGPLTDEMLEWVETNGLTNRIHVVSGCSNEALQALYSKADILLFPSLEEGFGWPIIEAQACGCRVVTTGKAPMTEVGGDAAVYIDPSAIKESARKVQEVLSESKELKAERINRGLENASRFSTNRMMEGYICEYQAAVKSRHDSRTK